MNILTSIFEDGFQTAVEFYGVDAVYQVCLENGMVGSYDEFVEYLS